MSSVELHRVKLGPCAQPYSGQKKKQVLLVEFRLMTCLERFTLEYAVEMSWFR